MDAQSIIKDTFPVDLMAPYPFSIDSLFSHILFYAIGITVLIGCVFVSIVMIKGIIKQFKKRV